MEWKKGGNGGGGSVNQEGRWIMHENKNGKNMYNIENFIDVEREIEKRRKTGRRSGGKNKAKLFTYVSEAKGKQSGRK